MVEPGLKLGSLTACRVLPKTTVFAVRHCRHGTGSGNSTGLCRPRGLLQILGPALHSGSGLSVKSEQVKLCEVKLHLQKHVAGG